MFPETHQALKYVQKVMKKTENSKLDTELKDDLLHKLELKEEQLNEVSLVSSSLEVETTMNSDVLTQGEKTAVNMELKNNGQEVVKHIDAAIDAQDKWTVEGEKKIKKIHTGEKKTVE